MSMQLDKSQVIALSLVVALVFNAVVHLSSPAYRYYKQQFALVEQRLGGRYSDYCQNVQSNVLHICAVTTTNLLEMVAARPAFSVGSTPAEGVSKVDSVTPILPEVDTLAYSYAMVDGLPLAVIRGQYYRCGDIFPRGGLISAISRDCILLDGKYRVTNKQKDETDGDRL